MARIKPLFDRMMQERGWKRMPFMGYWECPKTGINVSEWNYKHLPYKKRVKAMEQAAADCAARHAKRMADGSMRRDNRG